MTHEHLQALIMGLWSPTVKAVPEPAGQAQRAQSQAEAKAGNAAGRMAGSHDAVCVGRAAAGHGHRHASVLALTCAHSTIRCNVRWQASPAFQETSTHAGHGLRLPLQAVLPELLSMTRYILSSTDLGICNHEKDIFKLRSWCRRHRYSDRLDRGRAVPFGAQRMPAHPRTCCHCSCSGLPPRRGQRAKGSHAACQEHFQQQRCNGR